MGEDGPVSEAAPASRFSAATQAWFDASFAAPTAAQEGAWDAVSAGRHHSQSSLLN